MKDFMKKAVAVLSNYRYWVLFILSGLCTVCIMLDVDDNVRAAIWAYIVVSSKLLGFGFGYLFWKLYKRWEAKGTIPELVHFTNNF